MQPQKKCGPHCIVLSRSLKVISDKSSRTVAYCRAVGRSKNPGVPVLFGGRNLPHLVEIGLTDLPKSGGAMALPAPLGTRQVWYNRFMILKLIN